MHHTYLLEHKDGAHTSLPVFMANFHRIDNKADAQAYIKRLHAFRRQFRELSARLIAQSKAGITMPKFVYNAVLADIAKVTDGVPLTTRPDAPPFGLWQDFQDKLAKLTSLPTSERQALLREARQALVQDVGPAYRELAQVVKNLSRLATNEDGAWKHPQGDLYYRYQLSYFTSTSLSPEAVHKLGLQEVARLHAEMEAVKDQVGFSGNLRDFFHYVNHRPESYCPNSTSGREQCLEINRRIIASMRSKLPSMVSLSLRDDLEVRAVEAFREKSAPVAFYERPALDHSRPGIYYINLYDTKQVPIFEMEALAHHEAIPGHHLQISIAQGLEVPDFRRFYYQSAFGEGWGLYSEYFPKELGFYKDPYNDFGRLSMELWRAARLVVDTGIHYKRWSKEQAMAYLADATPADRSEIVSEVERYVVWPGQATAYKVGMNKILELRKRAEARLGKDFDVRAFHTEVLAGGCLPLPLLDQKIEHWLMTLQADEKKRASL